MINQPAGGEGSSLKRRSKKFDALEYISAIRASISPFPVLREMEPIDELVHCILSQNSNDSVSDPTFDLLKTKFPNWQSLLEADSEEIAEVIRPVGLAQQKSLAIQSSLRQIHEYAGEFSLHHLASMPLLEARAWLLKLKGVGLKTASIVLCFSFGKGAIPVDTHVFRVGKRMGWFPEKASEEAAHEALLNLVPPELALEFHFAALTHGKRICRSPSPYCENCAVSHSCRWFKAGGPEKQSVKMQAIRKKQLENNAIRRKKD